MVFYFTFLTSVLFSLGQVIRTPSILLVPLFSIGPLRVLENYNHGVVESFSLQRPQYFG